MFAAGGVELDGASGVRQRMASLCHRRMAGSSSERKEARSAVLGDVSTKFHLSGRSLIFIRLLQPFPLAHMTGPAYLVGRTLGGASTGPRRGVVEDKEVITTLGKTRFATAAAT